MGDAKSSELAALVERPLFDVGDETYTWGDAVLGAVARGTWAEVERSTRDGLACVHAVTASGDEPDPETTRAEARRFRYARDLLAAEELEAWRSSWGLGSAAWRDYLARRAATTRFAEELETVRARFPTSDGEVEAAVGAEAICSGFLEAAAVELAREAALADGARVRGSSPEAGRAAVLLGIDRDTAQQRLDDLAATAEAARQAPAATPTLAAVAREVEANALEWTAVAGELLEVADEDVAREAALCVRTDGQPLADVAALCGVPLAPLRLRLGDAGAATAALASAREGELVGPLPWNGGFGLVLVHEKRPPDASDAETHDRAAAAVAARAAERAVRERVRWHERA